MLQHGPERGAVVIRMKIRFCILAASLAGFLANQAPAQIAISAGPYYQSFDSLATTGTANPWTDNLTLPGWYASKTSGGPTVTTYRGDTGGNNAGSLYSFGVVGVNNLADRAFGSIASGTPGNFAYASTPKKASFFMSMASVPG